MESLNKISPIEENLIEGCDQKSAIYCSMFNALQTILTPEGQNVLKNNNIEKMAYSDLSALGLYIGKYVEQEINSSIVQLMRSIVGIEMPEFYCKRDPFFPIHDDEIYTKKTTRLNEQMPGKPYDSSSLKPIPLGDAYYACIHLYEEDYSQFDGYEWIFENRFKDLWRNLFCYRNRIAHAGDIISREDLIKNYELFVEFLEMYMPRISELKRDLSPEGMFNDTISITTSPKTPVIEDTQEDQKEKPRPTNAIINFVEMMRQNVSNMDFDDPEFQKMNVLYADYFNNYDWLDIEFEGEDGKKGLKNVKDEVVVPAKYDGFPYRFSYDYKIPVIPAILNGKMGLVRRDGSGIELTEFKYDAFMDMELSYYFFFKKDNSLSWGLISPEGKELLPCIIDTIFERDCASFYFKSGEKFGLVQPECAIVVPPVYENIEMCGELEDPLVFTLDGIKGYVTYNEQKFISMEKYEQLLEEGDNEEEYDDFECLICEQYW